MNYKENELAEFACTVCRKRYETCNGYYANCLHRSKFGRYCDDLF